MLPKIIMKSSKNKTKESLPNDFFRADHHTTSPSIKNLGVAQDEPSSSLQKTRSPYVLRPRKQKNMENVAVPDHRSVEDNVSGLPAHSLMATLPEARVVLEDITHLCEAVKPKELDSQAKTHSTDPLLAKDKGYLKALPEKQGICWPAMNEDAKWDSFSDAVMKKLSTASLNQSVGCRVKYLESAIYDQASIAFGHIVNKVKTIPNFVAKKHKTIELVTMKNRLHVQIQSSANSQELEGLVRLLASTKSELRDLRRKGNRRKRRWLRNRERKSFKVNPYRCGKDLLTDKIHASLKMSTIDLDQKLKSLHSNPLRDLVI